jgi:tellurite resistance protein TerC
MYENIIFFSLFLVLVMGVLLLDLLVIGRKSHEVHFREAAIWSGVWICLAFGFALLLRFFAEHFHGIENFDKLAFITRKYSPFLKLDPSRTAWRSIGKTVPLTSSPVT